MENLLIEATKSSPSVMFDVEKGILEIKGKSYPENAAKFYMPIFECLKLYLDSTKSRSIEIDMEIIYLNSSSSKALMNFLDILEKAAQDGNQVTVNWRYHEENETALECGEEFMEDLEGITFNLVKIPMD